ncbi:PD40 domain-containing protein [bacterium]|nr:PD40 domain-containing protein [bacterium]
MASKRIQMIKINVIAVLILVGGLVILIGGLTQAEPESIIFPEKPVAQLGKGIVREIAYSPDGKQLAVAESSGIWLYDADNLNEVCLLQGHATDVLSIAFSPDGKTLASVGIFDGIIRLWDVEAQKQVGLLKGHEDWVWSLAFRFGGWIVGRRRYHPPLGCSDPKASWTVAGT